MLQAAVGEGKQRSVQGTLGVLQDGIVLVDVLHYLGVELILLMNTSGEKKQTIVMITLVDTVKNKLWAFNLSAASLGVRQPVGDRVCLFFCRG